MVAGRPVGTGQQPGACGSVCVDHSLREWTSDSLCFSADAGSVAHVRKQPLRRRLPVAWLACLVVAIGPRADAADGVRTRLPEAHEYQRILRTHLASLDERDFEQAIVLHVGVVAEY